MAAAREWETRGNRTGRQSELHRSLNIFRFAGYALARAGRPDRAVEVLELGRARELSQWVSGELVDLERLEHIDPRLVAEFRELRDAVSAAENAELSGSPVSASEAAPAVERFRAVVDEIRRLPSFSNFLASASWAEIGEAIDAQEALVYIASAPYGSLAIVVWRSEGELEVEVIEARKLTSSDLMRSFLSADGRAGYFRAQAEGEDMNPALEEFGASLGAQLLAPLATKLREIGVARLCMVPTGLLGLLPLHALACNAVEARCLLDDFSVVFAPSALVRAVCRKRRDSGQPVRRSLIIGDPQPSVQPLTGAAFEISMIAQLMAGHQVEVLSGTDATRDRVLEHLPGADHVHFACHGAASFFDEALGAALYLSDDEPLTARDVLALRGFHPRLVVASACETGVIQSYAAADESLTLGTVFLASGAVAVISTLWAIDDYATSLLMNRLYELLADEADPVDALREAQLWLRDLSQREEEAYLAERPRLLSHCRKLAKSSRRSSGSRELRPYSDAYYWAPFVLAGA